MRAVSLEAPAFQGAATTRLFQEEDRLACELIAAEAARSSYAPAMPDLHETFGGREPLENADHRWVAVWDSRIVGFVDLVGNHIANLFVHPTAQGRGVGTMLVGAAERATVGDLTLSVFVVNPRARALYERLGFQVISEEITPFRGTSKRVWRMRKSRPVAQRYRLVVFDFDGVLADSADWMLRTIPTVAAEFGLTRLSTDELQALRAAPTRTILRTLRAPGWKMPFIARRMRRLSAAAADEIALFPGAAEVLLRLKRRNLTTAVVSSNGVGTVRAVLGPELLSRFDHLDCGIGLFGKAPRLRRLARITGISPAEAVYVGDETRDVEAAKRAGFASAAATWGYATREALMASKPSVTVDTIEALEDWLSPTGVTNV